MRTIGFGRIRNPPDDRNSGDERLRDLVHRKFRISRPFSVGKIIKLFSIGKTIYIISIGKTIEVLSICKTIEVLSLVKN
jgi:hypothetical protein